MGAAPRHGAAASLLPGAPLRGGGCRGKGGSGAKRVGEGLPKRVAPSPLHVLVPRTPQKKGFGRGGLGDEATPGIKPP